MSIPVVASVLTTAAAWLLPGGVTSAGNGGDFTAAPTDLSFPDTYVGDSVSMEVVVTNVSGSPQTISMAGGAAGDPNFTGSQNCQGNTLDPGETCSVTYAFQPQTQGMLSASTSFTINGESFFISMSGTGLFPFSVAPTDLSFPDTAVGESSSMEVVVTNLSGSPQTISMAGGAAGDPNFMGSQNCQGNTLDPGETCSVTYAFQPQTEGMLSASTSFTINGESFSISMSGTGIDPSATTSPTTEAPPTTEAESPTTTSPPEGTSPPEATSPTTTPVPISPIPGPITAGDAQVIAQGIVAFPAGSFRWDHQQLDPGAWPFDFVDAPPSFVAADGPDAVLVTDDTGPAALLDAGEAALIQSGSSGSVAPMSDDAEAAARRITFVPGDGPGAFAPGEGPRDVNLIGDVLAPDDTVGVTSPFPVLVVVTDGELVDTTGSVIDVTTGAVTLGPTIELRNDSTDPAAVLIAAVGGDVA